MARRKSDLNSVFGAALVEHLARHSLRQSDLAKSQNVDPAYVNRLIRKDAPSPEWVNIIADATGADAEERLKLHRAAARAKGYEV